MQNVQEELPALINALLQSPAAVQRRLIERCYAPGARMTHVLVMAENREEIIRIFQQWRFSNRHNSVSMHEMVYQADERSGRAKVWAQASSVRTSSVLIQPPFTQHVHCFLHMPISFALPMSTLLYLEPAADGTKAMVITKQVDFHSFEGMLYTMPLLGAVLEYGFRRLVAWAILLPAQAAGALLPPLDAWLSAQEPLAGRWSGIKEAAALLWWARPCKGRHLPEGRHLAPYDPHL